MLQFLLRRLSLVIPTFFGVTLLTFALIRLIPGDPIELLAGERALTPERHAEMKARLGLDKPLLEQYGIYSFRSSPSNGVSTSSGRKPASMR